jgi:hypothetical protein
MTFCSPLFRDKQFDTTAVVCDLKASFSFAPSVLDSAALAVLAKDLSKGGNILTKYQIKNYHGRTYIVIKGYPALRQHLTGTRYLASHPKAVSMGIGKMGTAKAIKGGFVLSKVLSVGFHALDQLLNEQKTWHHFVGGVAVKQNCRFFWTSLGSKAGILPG